MDFKDLSLVVVAWLLLISSLNDLWRKRFSLRSNVLGCLFFAMTFLVQYLAVGFTWQSTVYLFAVFFGFFSCMKSALISRRIIREINLKI